MERIGKDVLMDNHLVDLQRHNCQVDIPQATLADLTRLTYLVVKPKKERSELFCLE
jgi:hypothetical protein